MLPAAAGEEDAIPGGIESCADGMDQNVHEYYHAACYGAFIAGSPIELRNKLLAAACVTEGISPAFGQRLDAIVHSMEAIDDGHRFRLAYLRGGGSRKSFKTTRPVRETVAPQATFAKDATKDAGRSKAKVEPPPVDKAE
eukprot:jgi/Tetstr1/429610/TSEL_019508.t1